jgi:quercetin dioxygenase-like cupin family protein
MEIIPRGTVPSKKANSDWFTGNVWQDVIIESPSPARVHVIRVSFEPGSRTAWHSHPLGQTLHILFGVGLIATRKGKPKLLKAGDTAWIPPSEEHWHGATQDNGMIHLAIQESLDGKTAFWLDKVSDKEYLL